MNPPREKKNTNTDTHMQYIHTHVHTHIHLKATPVVESQCLLNKIAGTSKKFITVTDTFK